jgi:hypothetical protein
MLLCASLAASGCSSLSGGGHAGATTTTRPKATTTTIPDGTATPYASILEGQCFDQLPSTDQQPFAALVIPCERRHLYEVYATYLYTDDAGHKVPFADAYPGENVVRTRAEALCYAAFQPWMGTEWTKSAYDIQSWWPSADSWTKHDRAVLCAVDRYDGKHTTGSVRGAKE